MMPQDLQPPQIPFIHPEIESIHRTNHHRCGNLTRQSRLLRRHPGSLGLLALLLSAAAALCHTPWELQRHHKTSDDDIEVLYVFDDEALFQYRFPTFDGKRSYRLDLVRAVPGDEPEVATAIGDEVRAELVQEIDAGCRVRLKTGMKLLLTGCEPPPKARHDV